MSDPTIVERFASQIAIPKKVSFFLEVNSTKE
jgi:hypothetical protein